MTARVNQCVLKGLANDTVTGYRIMTIFREGGMQRLLACKIRRFMVVWRYKNGKESRWEE